MRREDLIVAVLCLIVAAVVLQQSLPHYFTEQGTPGPGAYPCYIAALLAVCGFSIFVHWLKGNCDRKAGSFFPRGRAAKLLVLTAVALVAYRVGMDILGFTAASLLLMIFLMRILGDHGWWKTILYSVVFVGLVSYTFRTWLYMDLPRGLLGI